MENPAVFTVLGIEVTTVTVITWIMMAVVFAFAAVVRLRLRASTPGKLQQVVEGMLSWLGDEVTNIVGRDPWPFIPLVASLFIFILVSNLSTLFFPFVNMRPPTADINTTAALATIVFLAVPFYGVAISGTWYYVKTYFQPVWIMMPFNVISDLSRTLALAIRLFGNVFSGEILVGVVLTLVPFILPVPLMFLSLITGTIQAYIFAVLAIVYIGGAVKAVEKHQIKETA